MRIERLRIAFFGLLVVFSFTATSPAWAYLKLCNATSSKVGVAIGYKDKNVWVSEGWWNVDPHDCETLLKGNLVAQYYYIHAVDYDRGGEWAGKSFLCLQNKKFTIRGGQDCARRGYQRAGFFEVNTGEANNWTIRLRDPVESEKK